MSGVFQLVGGAGDPIAEKLTTSTATVIAEAVTGAGRVMVPWFRLTETTGNATSVAVDILKPDTTVVYIRPSTTLGATSSLLYEEGHMLLEGWKLRVTAAVSSRIDVTGLKLIDNT